MHESSTAGGEDEAPREDAQDTKAQDTKAQDSRASAGAAEAGPAGAGAGRADLEKADRSRADLGEAAPGGAGPEGVARGAAEPPRVRRAPERSQAEQDEIFAALIAQFDDPVDLNNPDWPEIEDLRARGELKGGFKDGAGPRTDPDDLSDLAPQPRPRSGRPVMPAAGSGPRDFELAAETDEEHFVPPEPPPLPPADTTAKFAWLAVLGGPALLLFDAVVWREVAGWPAWVGVTAFLGGFVTLVVRMKERDEDEPEDPHGGAVV
ncbi:hypothetical protein [Kitasatospora sp. A2-31]|uniref:hypothetical protein n=1 Tax=Kitasatospora sp. A2-31 TaxID=2916414 RepID=UPI0027E30A07|nr:hypothetical protein [Kitasatospora sp. A2-31]